MVAQRRRSDRALELSSQINVPRIQVVSTHTGVGLQEIHQSSSTALHWIYCHSGESETPPETSRISFQTGLFVQTNLHSLAVIEKVFYNYTSFIISYHPGWIAYISSQNVKIPSLAKSHYFMQKVNNQRIARIFEHANSYILVTINDDSARVCLYYNLEGCEIHITSTNNKEYQLRIVHFQISTKVITQ